MASGNVPSIFSDCYLVFVIIVKLSECVEISEQHALWLIPKAFIFLWSRTKVINFMR